MLFQQSNFFQLHKLRGWTPDNTTGGLPESIYEDGDINMKHSRLLSRELLALTLLAVIAMPFSARAQSAIELDFEVNAAKTTRVSAESSLRTNVVAYVHESITPYMWRQFFRDHRVGDVLIDTVGITKDARDFNDIKHRMTELDKLVQEIVSRGGRVQLVFQNGIPRWLSSDPHNEGDLFAGGLSAGQKIWHSVPPADYGEWEKIAYAFVNHFNNVLDTKGKVYYVVGSEPESYWVGNEQEFLRYYKHFVIGARKADPNAKIGGINVVGLVTNAYTKYNPKGVSGGQVKFEKFFTKDKQPIVYNWLRYSAKEKLPVDVVAWHDYPAPSPIPGKTANWVVVEKKINNWLSKLGYPKAELIFNDWPEWRPVEYENDSEFQAAYVASSLISMEKHTSVKPLYLGMRDLSSYSKNARANASFGGGTGLFTSIGLIKPVYNTYVLLGKMKGEIIRVDTGDEFVRALATVDKDALYLLLTNFIPSKRIMFYNTYGVEEPLADEDKARIKKAMKNKGMSREELVKAIFGGKLDVDKLDLPPQISKRVKGTQRVHAESQRRKAQPAKVNVRLTGFRGKGGTWNYEEFVVDESHANTYSVRRELVERAQSMGLQNDKRKLREFVDQVNERFGVESGRVEQKTISAKGSSPEIRTTLQPNSVHLIVLRKSN